jgi:hypothetical protein
VSVIPDEFVQYYWRQVALYTTAGEATILQQNTDRQAAIVNLVYEMVPLAAGWRDLIRP